MKLSSLLAKLDNSQGVADAELLPDQEASARRMASVVAPEGFLAMIEMMREQGKYDFADETLRGIYDTVKARSMVTEAQQRAVYNIRHANCDSCRRHRGLEDCDVDDDY